MRIDTYVHIDTRTLTYRSLHSCALVTPSLSSEDICRAGGINEGDKKAGKEGMTQGV